LAGNNVDPDCLANTAYNGGEPRIEAFPSSSQCP
jgi:hypothetical protein